ncbi:SET domain-containing protein [Cavenderia fasciculata]|uniref:SET domain-containing protein n=1 Tax=Cavenderia fasciculata TaxID=261658 RepID=F4PRU9_CACFS|nr:SET domain-containing protein [Cavenderia fasciculata]EGG21385.1 SET domain-containing protein [Cavenderia fasciculata]|eukprot:XP_004359235.1 SET domain-containing protein [Cavenderia fasciculata]
MNKEQLKDLNLDTQQSKLIEKLFQSMKDGSLSEEDLQQLRDSGLTKKLLQKFGGADDSNSLDAFMNLTQLDGITRPVQEDISLLTYESVLKRMDQLKRLGNERFQKSHYTYAHAYYYQLIQLGNRYGQEVVEKQADISEELKQERLAQLNKVASLAASNLSLTFFNTNRIEESLKYADLAIQLDKSNAKAYFRRVHALQLFGRIGEVKQTFEQATKEIQDATLQESLEYEIHAQKEKDQLFEKNKQHTLKRIETDKQYSQFPVELVWNDNMGRCIMATRDIKQGELILRVAPFGCALSDDQIDLNCGSCFRKIKYYKSEKCNSCKTNLLCEICIKDPTIVSMHQEECSLISFLQKHYPNAQTRDFRFMIRVLLSGRANKLGRITKEKTPQLWNQQPFIYDSYEDLASLTTDVSKIESKQLQSFTVATNSITNFFAAVKGPKYLSDPFTKQEIFDLYPKILFNAHEYIDPLTHYEIGRGIYPTASYINHTCLPNTTWYNDDHGLILYRSSRDILKGEEITTSYLDILKPKLQRRKDLKQYSFVCQCERCLNEKLGYLCSECGEELTEKQIEIWDPIPEKQFDGRVIVCSKGHFKPLSVYESLESIGETACQQELIPTFNLLFAPYHPIHIVLYKKILSNSIRHFDEPSKIKINTVTDPQLLQQYFDALWKSYKNVFQDPENVIMFSYVDDLSELFQLYKKLPGDNRAKLLEIKDKAAFYLETQTKLSQNQLLKEFEDYFQI